MSKVPRRRQPLPKRNAYTGPTTCLRCEKTFLSWDRRQNRLCPACRDAIQEEPSEERPYRLPTRRHLRGDEG